MQFEVGCVLRLRLLLHLENLFLNPFKQKKKKLLPLFPRYGPLNYLFHWERPWTEGDEGVEAGAMAVNADGDEPRQENTNVSGDAGGHASDASEQEQDSRVNDEIWECGNHNQS